MPLTYYVQFRSAAGDLLTGTDGQTWFAVSGVGVDIASTVNLGSGSGNTGSVATLNPLRFTLGTDTIDPALLATEALGKVFSQIELAGYSGTGSNAVLVTDDVYKDAALTSLTSQSGGLAVSAAYADTVHRAYATNAHDNPVPPTIAGYDSLTRTADTSTNKVDGTPGNAPDAPLFGPPPVTDTSAPLSFYVQFRDLSGNALANGAGQTWFAISGLTVPSTQTVHLNGTGTGVGRIVFDPVAFALDGAALPVLLTELVKAATLGTVEIAGYSGTGATAVLTEDFTDRHAQVKTLLTGPDGSQTVALQTTDLVQSVIPAASGGLAASAAVTAGWNATLNTPDNRADTRAGLVGAPTAAPAAALTYYVQFRDGSGTLLTGDGGQTWFAAAGVGFGAEQTYGASGAASGASFDPLTFTLAPDAILANLFASQAGALPLRQIELAGYDGAGMLVTDDAFKLAIATTDAANADGTATLAFDFKALTQTTDSRDAMGQTHVSTQGYNVVTKSIDTSTTGALDAPKAAVPPTRPGPGSLTYYVQFREHSGALLSGTDGKTWFAVTNVGFDTTQTLGTGSNSSAGKVKFGALSFTLGADAVLPRLLTLEGSGVSFQSVELAGYAGSGAGAALVEDDLFKLAAIGSSAPQPDGAAGLSIQYGGLLETAYAPDVNGTLVAVASHGWNAVRNSTDNTTAPIGGGTAYALAAPPTGTPPVAVLPGALTYFVQFRAYNGSYVSDANGATWFAVTGLSLPSTQTLNIGSQSGGAGAGRLVFGPASFTFVDPLLQPKLFIASASGTAYESVEIAGYAGAGASATLVQDDVLKLAAVAAVQSGSDSSTAVSLDYGGLVERSFAPNQSGTDTLAGIGGWNAVLQVSDTSTSSLASSAGGGASNGAVPVAPLAGTPAGAARAVPLTYYIEFQPTSDPQAPLRDAAGYSFFAVEDLSFRTVQTLNIGSQTSGAGAGRITFDPLTFTLAPTSISSTLLADLTLGKSFFDVFVVGYDTSGAAPVKTVLDALKLVAVKDITTNSDGSEAVSLDYGGLQESTFTSGTGGAGKTASAGWDRVKNIAAAYPDISGAPSGNLPNANPACYGPSTRIATPAGEVAVGTLAIGDLVLTADGRAEPVVWIGRRSYHGRFVAGRRDILPVTIAAGALADGLPARDLTISPEHAMLIDGLLVPARALVNGTTVTQAVHVDAVHYIHVELAQHEAILAEGAASESFVDDDSRNAFHNASEWQGERRKGPARYCAPRVESGFELEAIRRRIARRVAKQAA